MPVDRSCAVRPRNSAQGALDAVNKLSAGRRRHAARSVLDSKLGGSVDWYTPDVSQPKPVTENEHAFVAAVTKGDAARVRELFATDDALRVCIDACWFAFDAPAIVFAKSNRALVDVLLEFGADINKRSEWALGGFGVLDGTDDETAAFLIEHGAVVDIHAAAWLRQADLVRAFLVADSKLVHARGGDGQLPLHVARTREIIDVLLESGADLEARDFDHSATAAQYAVGQDMEKCRYLIERGAVADLFLAVALGDRGLVDRVLEREPEALATKIGSCPHTSGAPGGHIYTWRLRGAATPLGVARAFGHNALYADLYALAPPSTQFAAACWEANSDEARKLLQANVSIQRDESMLARAAWENRIDTVRLLLELGFDPHVPGPHESTPLDRAAFHGFLEIVSLLLRHDPAPPIHKENEFGGTPLGACLHGAVHGWRKDGDYPATVELLLQAGSKYTSSAHPVPEISAVLARYLDRRTS